MGKKRDEKSLFFKICSKPECRLTVDRTDVKLLEEKFARGTGWDKLDSYCRDCRHKHDNAYHSGKGRAQENERNKLVRKNEKFKLDCWKITNKAIEDGVLIPQPCACGNGKPTDPHHDDYSKPLEVKWFCRSCHVRYHDSLKGGRRKGKFISLKALTIGPDGLTLE